MCDKLQVDVEVVSFFIGSQAKVESYYWFSVHVGVLT